MRNLAAEGFTSGVHLVGDVMLDVLHWAGDRARERVPGLLLKLGIERHGYLVATLHRSENTDDTERLSSIVDAFNALGERIVFPIHPRARKAMDELGIRLAPHIEVIEPVGYVDMVALVGSRAWCSPIPAACKRKRTGWACLA